MLEPIYLFELLLCWYQKKKIKIHCNKGFRNFANVFNYADAFWQNNLNFKAIFATSIQYFKPTIISCDWIYFVIKNTFPDVFVRISWLFSISYTDIVLFCGINKCCDGQSCLRRIQCTYVSCLYILLSCCVHFPVLHVYSTDSAFSGWICVFCPVHVFVYRTPTGYLRTQKCVHFCTVSVLFCRRGHTRVSCACTVRAKSFPIVSSKHNVLKIDYWLCQAD